MAEDTASEVPTLDDGHPASAPRRRHRPRRRAAWQWTIFSLPVLGDLAAGWAHRNLTEDAFIYLRVVHQVTAGHGPVYNVGERVEAFTGTAWLFLLTVADLVTPIRLEYLAVALGLLCGAAGLLFAMAGARRLWTTAAVPTQTWFVPVGALVFVSLLPVWVYTGDGLENGLVYGWLGACLWILATWAGAPDRRLSTPRAVVLGLGWLVRPELVIYSALFFVLVLALDRSDERRRARVRVALAMLALPVAYQLFRMGYYGSLVSNTAVAKEGGSFNWARGFRYLRDFVGPYWLWVPAIVLLLGAYLPFAAAMRRGSRVPFVVGAFVAGAALEGVWVVAIGGDYLHARLFLPSVFALLAPVAAIPLVRRTAVALLVVPWAVVAMGWLKPDQYRGDHFFAHGFVITLPDSYGTVTVADQGWGPDRRGWYTGPGYYRLGGAYQLAHVRSDIPRKADLPLPFGSFAAIGVAGYALGGNFHILDNYGLADPFTAHLVVTPSRKPLARVAGHSKPLPNVWVAARVTRPGSRPDERDFPSPGNPLIPTTHGLAFQRQVAWARAALRCDGIKEVLAAAEAPLTPGRFLSNLVHSFDNARVRIPPDPKAAYHEFCGPGTPREVRALDRG